MVTSSWQYWRIAVIAVAAALIAFSIGSATDFIAADIAGIWALISVKPTLHNAVREILVQVVGTVIGGLVGFLAVTIWGFNIWLMGALITFGFVLGYLLKLGVEGSAIIGFTMIAVTSNSFSLETTEARIFGVMLGTLVATVLSLFVLSGTPQSRLVAAIKKFAAKRNQLTVDLANYIAEQGNDENHTTNIDELYSRGQALIIEIRQLERDADDALRGSKWTPLTSKAAIKELSDEIHQDRVAVITLVDMIEGVRLIDSKLPDTVAIKLSNKVKKTLGSDDALTEVIDLSEMSDNTHAMIIGDIVSGAKKLKRARAKNQPK